MNRKFIINLFILLLLNFLIKPFWILGIDRSVQNVVGPESYGFYFSLLNFTFLFNILLDFGITNFNNKNIAQNHQLLNKHFSSLLILKLLLAVVYFLITFSVALIIGYNTYQISILAIMCFNQFLISFILYLRSNISGLHLFKTDSFLSVLDRIIMIIICALLLWGHIWDEPFRIEWFVLAQTLSYIITVCIAIIIVIKKAQFHRLQWNKLFFFMIIKKSLPFALLVLLMSFYNRIDSVMLERILPNGQGEQQSGIYAAAFRLLDASNMIAYLFAVILLPMFARMLKWKNSIENLTTLSFSLIFVISITVAAACFFYGRPLMEMLYPQHPDENMAIYTDRIIDTSRIFSIIILGFIPISCTYIFGTLLTANGNLKFLNWMALGGMILNLCLNFVLIPQFMAYGSAWASLSTQVLTALAQVFIVVKVFSFKINRTFLWRIFIFCLLTFTAAYFSRFLSRQWEINILILLITAMIIALSARLIPIFAFITLLKKTEK